jgi:hypothetical protein
VCFKYIGNSRERFITRGYYLELWVSGFISEKIPFPLIALCAVLQGNKKGPLGRWDFDTQEEYSEYMNNKEALPK